MKNLALVLLIMAFSVGANAAPFLVCDDPDPAEQVTSYDVFQDGVLIGTTPAPLHFDLQGVTPGQYNFTATSRNAWGLSDPSNPYVSPASATQPLNINMEP